MTNLTEILQDCFPRVFIKNQNEYRKMFETLMDLSVCKDLTEFVCQECQKNIRTEKTVIIKHLSTHLLYKYFFTNSKIF